MVRVDLSQLSFSGTWIDGYIPNTEEMKRLAKLYGYLDIGEDRLPKAYGFSQAPEEWTNNDYFTSIATAIRSSFDREKFSPITQPMPCGMWLIKIDNEPSDSKIRPIYDEYKVGPNKKNYYHLVTIHNECPVHESCLQKVMQDLHFDQKSDTEYIDPQGFQRAVHKLLYRCLSIMAAPWTEIERDFDVISGGRVFGGIQDSRIGNK